MSSDWLQVLVALVVATTSVATRAAGGNVPITPDEALVEALAANARLPVAATDVAIGRARLREARGQRWAALALQGDFRYAPRGATYNPAETANEERLQLVAQQPLYEGGRLSAAIRGAQADLRARGARYRATAKDVELDVRSAYATLVALDDELRLRKAGIRELESYLDTVELRQKAGQGLYGDVLRTRARLAGERADLADAERRHDVTRAAFDDLLGRDPAAPLKVVPLPQPSPPPMPTDEPWRVAPELREAGANIDVARAALGIARAERRPQLALSADTGLWGVGISGDGGFAARLRQDFGFSVGLSVSWAFFDFGVYRARIAEAQLGITAAEQQRTLVLRAARLQWRQSVDQLTNLYRELEARARAAPVAHDAWLEAVATYRGGAATPLEVLDAWSTWIAAELALSTARLDYRIAQATARRWATP